MSNYSSNKTSGFQRVLELTRPNRTVGLDCYGEIFEIQFTASDGPMALLVSSAVDASVVPEIGIRIGMPLYSYSKGTEAMAYLSFVLRCMGQTLVAGDKSGFRTCCQIIPNTVKQRYTDVHFCYSDVPVVGVPERNRSAENGLGLLLATELLIRRIFRFGDDQLWEIIGTWEPITPATKGLWRSRLVDAHLNRSILADILKDCSKPTLIKAGLNSIRYDDYGAKFRGKVVGSALDYMIQMTSNRIFRVFGFHGARNGGVARL